MDITNVFTAFIALLVALLSCFVIPWIKTKVSTNELAEMLKWVEIAVMAAQQLYHDLSGSDRLEYALDFLKEKGYDVENDEIRNAIEAAVLQLHQQLEGV